MSEERFGSYIVRARQGDRSALDAALRCVESRMRRAAQLRLRKGSAILSTSDALQSTYLDVVRKIGTFRGDDEVSFAAWVTAILENNIRDQAKSHNRVKRRTPGGKRVAPEAVPSPGPTPSGHAMQIESLHAVGRAFDGLDDDQRRILTYRMIEERSYSEIATLLDRSEGAARMLYSRARTALALEMDRLLHDSE